MPKPNLPGEFCTSLCLLDPLTKRYRFCITLTIATISMGLLNFPLMGFLVQLQALRYVGAWLPPTDTGR